MSQASPHESALPAPETRGQRIVKYGANVALNIVIVILLAGIAVWGAQKFRKRANLSANANVKLKPQTVKIISELRSPIRIVGLYARIKPEVVAAANQQDFYQPVVDLLDEYRRNGSQVDIQMIDPVAEPAKVDAWVAHIIEKYGGDVPGYRKFLSEFPAALKRIKADTTAEAQRMQNMLLELAGASPQTQGQSIEQLLGALSQAVGKFKDPRQFQRLNNALAVVLALTERLDEIEQAIKPELDKKLPNYRVATDEVTRRLNDLSSTLGKVAAVMVDLGGKEEPATAPSTQPGAATQPSTQPSAATKPTTDASAGVPPLARDYARKSAARYKAMQKTVDDELAKIKSLGELKLDKVYEKLNTLDETEAASIRTIAVEAPGELRVITFKDVWKPGGSGLRGAAERENMRYRFAGEQQITAAILSLTQKRSKVAFIHAGPTASFQDEQAYSDIIDRLKSYNFDVEVKDIMPQQPMQPGMPPMPGADLADVKDAVWVVFAEPSLGQQFGMPSTSSELASKVREHLDQGGAAMVLAGGQAALMLQAPDRFYNMWKMMLSSSPMPDPFESVLEPYGVRLRGDLLAVHERIGDPSDEAEDFVEQARRSPPIFVLNDFGDHPVTAPVYSLDAAFVPLQPVDVMMPPPPGAKVSRIIPLPSAPPSWGEKDIESVRGGRPTLDTNAGDVPGGYGGAIAEREGKGRLIVIGSPNFVNNGFLQVPDPRARRQQEEVARFPGNGELFTNGIFWLAKMDSMMALSPAAMDTPRVAKIAPGKLAFLQYGVFVIGLPGLVVVAGLLVWQRRGD